MTDLIVPIEPDPEVAGKLGRNLVWHDEQSRKFPARGVLFAAGAPLRDRVWRRPRAWNQAESSMCVIYSGKGVCNTTPITKTIKRSLRTSLFNYAAYYAFAQQHDPWPGESYGGTSTLAGFKALHHAGLIPGYRWCFGVDDVIQCLANYGPVAVGVNWYHSMFNVDAENNLIVDLSSGLAGGHCVELHGLDVDGKKIFSEDDYVIGTNSWGQGWGDRGRFRLKISDLRYLLEASGEAVTVASTTEASETEG